MLFDHIMTKEFLIEKLIVQKITMIRLSQEVGCTKHTLIKYCKRYEIYDEVRKSSKFAHKITEDLKDKTFGKFKVLSLGPNDPHGKTRWLCRCECGVEKLVNAGSLLRKLSESCGKCSRGHFTGYKDISGRWWKLTQQSAIDRSYSWEITHGFIWDLYEKQNRKCALSGLDIVFCRNSDNLGKLQTASIDRIDSKLGYLTTNVQLVHKRVQRIKSIVPQDEFIFWCKLVYLNHLDYAKDLTVDLSNVNYNTK